MSQNVPGRASAGHNRRVARSWPAAGQAPALNLDQYWRQSASVLGAHLVEREPGLEVAGHAPRRSSGSRGCSPGRSGTARTAWSAAAGSRSSRSSAARSSLSSRSLIISVRQHRLGRALRDGDVVAADDALRRVLGAPVAQDVGGLALGQVVLTGDRVARPGLVDRGGALGDLGVGVDVGLDRSPGRSARSASRWPSGRRRGRSVLMSVVMSLRSSDMPMASCRSSSR